MQINKQAKITLLMVEESPKNLESFAKLIKNVYDLDTIVKMEPFLKMKNHPQYNEYYNLFFSTILPWMINRVKAFLKSRSMSVLDRLKCNIQKSISLTKSETCDLLIAMFFGIYDMPGKNIHVDLFQWLCGYESIYCEKLLCLFEYFRQFILTKPEGTIKISRHVLSHIYTKEMLTSDCTPLKPVRLFQQGLIGDIPKDIKVDFANKYIGGGVLGTGCVQEEIMFTIAPELIVSMLFCDVMKDVESICIEGTRPYSKYTGYAWTFKFDGPLLNSTNTSDTIIAIDALHFRSYPQEQLLQNTLLREFNKAYIGFSSPETKDAIATGKWGCGAFRGYAPIKFLLQWIACSLLNKDIHFYTFDDILLTNQISDFVAFVDKYHITVGQLTNSLMLLLFNSINEMNSEVQINNSFFAYMKESLSKYTE
ncbi:hypothetical protein WA158_008331 [Blastocystis sp. Blastoise]